MNKKLIILTCAIIASVTVVTFTYPNTFADNTCEDITLTKKNTDKKACVSYDAALVLIDRGWGELRQSWGNACKSFTSTTEHGCYLDRDPPDLCYNITERSSCFDFDKKPTTLQDCKDLYMYGYLESEIFIEPEYFSFSFLSYALTKCDVGSFDIKDTSKQCQDNWKINKEISKNDVGIKGEERSYLGFLLTSCVDETYPDYSSWGCWNTPRTGTESCGSLYNFKLSMRQNCSTQDCTFNFYDGPSSTIRCPEISKNYRNYYDHIITYDPETYEISCRLPGS